MTAKSLDGRLALITGASRGIGRAVALAMAKAGAHVIITARRVSGLEDLDDEIRAFGGNATLVKLDLTDGDKVDALGPTIYERWRRLDVLVANAGILGPLSPLPHITVDSWTAVLDVNLNANWRLIRTCDPLLRNSDAGRAIFVTSGAADAQRAYWGAYAVSKAALEALAKTYAHEVENTNVRVNLINPGPMRTNMRAQAFPGEDPETLPTPDEVAPLFLELANSANTANGRRFDFQRK
jgi:NAD(P)-dependent dehydrogenase (short-subunit alcohol dehydrogenase family)